MGKLNHGWEIALYLLSHEREMISWAGMTQSGARALSTIATDTLGTRNGVLDNPMLRSELARFEMDELAFTLTAERARDEARSGASLGHASSFYKYYGTELNKRRQELLMSLHGSDALRWNAVEEGQQDFARNWLRSKGNSIEGGTSEIQLNIVAKRILGLPS